ncbi:MAG: hypothetical protein ABSB89_05990 [Candidatus Bathyarchaeia archaeon]
MSARVQTLIGYSQIGQICSKNARQEIGPFFESVYIIDLVGF